VINPAILPHIKGLGLLETFIIVTSATLLASVLLFYFVETPCRDFVKSRLKPRERSLSLATPVDTMAPAA
jgi:peptidoglycan/LPS O-acetylase OafA/YrhL